MNYWNRNLLISHLHQNVKIKTQICSFQFGGRVKESEKRDKRQILYFINRPFQLMARSPRTTPNPFIRDTHIEEYDIIRPEVGEREGMIPTIETGSSDPGSYPLVVSILMSYKQVVCRYWLSALKNWHLCILYIPLVVIKTF